LMIQGVSLNRCVLTIAYSWSSTNSLIAATSSLGLKKVREKLSDKSFMFVLMFCFNVLKWQEPFFFESAAH
jgi:hypothetical protein